MQAAVFREFKKPFHVVSVDDPTPESTSVVIEVKANGICRSDWHAWMGHDASVKLPHVPGHEMSGIVAEVGAKISRFRVGDRVTVPFACGCGSCRYCRAGQLHICDYEFQPGFTHWGAFAQYVEIQHADHNLVRLPDALEFVAAASLGCRFSTAYRAIAHQANVQEGSWLAIHGCGGLGLSCVMIGKQLGARIVVVDVDDSKIRFAQELGADQSVNASVTEDVAGAILDLTCGGADASIDALGSRVTATNSISSLRKQGRHIQIGLLLGDEADPPLPIGRVISRELQLFGSHGMSRTDYPNLLAMVTSGKLDPMRLVSSTISLSKSPEFLTSMNEFRSLGVTVINNFTT